MIGLSQRPGRKLACQQAVQLVTDYLEGALPRAQRRRFEAHLANCAHCPEYLAQIRVIIALTGSITPADLSAQLRGELIDLYQRWRADEDQDALARAADAGQDRGDAFPGVRRARHATRTERAAHNLSFPSDHFCEEADHG